MKLLIGIFTIITLDVFSQSRIGIINDSDGYTNVRLERTTDSKIIGKYFSYRPFEFTPNNSNWVSVKLDNGQTGYIHKSRIREITNCTCKNWGGSKLPLFVFPLTTQTIEVCASSKKEISENEIEISETRISNCSTGKTLLEIGAIDYAILELNKNTLTVKKLKNLPIGKNWSFVKTPIRTWTLDLESNNPNFKEASGLVPPYVSNDQSINLVSQVKANPPNDAGEFEGLMFKLFVAAISGNREAEQLFRNHREKFGIVLDGSVAEDFSQLRSMLDEYQKGQ